MPLGSSSRRQSYWEASRSPRYSLTFALPLLLGYEALAVLLPFRETHGVRNGAEVILRTAFVALAGRWGDVLFGATVIGIAVWFVARDVRANGAPGRLGIFAGMAIESLLLAASFAVVTSLLTAQLVGALRGMALADVSGMDAPTRLMVSLGAGIFEELLFRVVLVTILITLARVVLHAGPRASAAIAILFSALIFSAFHYVGPYGDRLTLPSFLFRTIGGILFSAIFVLRGFGIVAWTHALYDVGLLLLLGS
jgi:hypothetical protein